MKKIITNTLGLMIIATLVASCGKTTKGKMANEWQITSFEGQRIYSSTNGGVTITSEPEAIRGTSTTFSSGDIQGTITENSIVIEKDGTWSQNLSYSTTRTEDNFMGNGQTATITTNYVGNMSGNWYLSGKNKSQDLKKNEIVNFYAANGVTKFIERTTVLGVTTVTDSDTTDVTGNNYPAGFYIPITGNFSTWKVIESKGKKLVIEHTDNSTDTEVDSNGESHVDKTTGAIKVTLEQQ